MKRDEQLDTKISQKARDVIRKYAGGLFKDSALEFYGEIKELINVELPIVEVTDSSTDYIFLLDGKQLSSFRISNEMR